MNLTLESSRMEMVVGSLGKVWAESNLVILPLQNDVFQGPVAPGVIVLSVGSDGEAREVLLCTVF